MRKLKRAFTLLMALVMTMGLCLTSSFAAAVTVTVSDNSGLSNHTYVAYQIFTGTQADSEGMLGDVEWGTDIGSDKFISALKNKFESDATLGTYFLGFKTSTEASSAGVNATTALEVAQALAYIAGSNESGNNTTTDSDDARAVAKIAYDSLSSAATGTQLSIGSGNSLEPGYYLIVDTTDVSGGAMMQRTPLCFR